MRHAGDAVVTLQDCGVGDGSIAEAEFTLYTNAAGWLIPPSTHKPALVPSFDTTAERRQEPSNASMGGSRVLCLALIL